MRLAAGLATIFCCTGTPPIRGARGRICPSLRHWRGSRGVAPGTRPPRFAIYLGSVLLLVLLRLAASGGVESADGADPRASTRSMTPASPGGPRARRAAPAGNRAARPDRGPGRRSSLSSLCARRSSCRQRAPRPHSRRAAGSRRPRRGLAAEDQRQRSCASQDSLRVSFHVTPSRSRPRRMHFVADCRPSPRRSTPRRRA